MSPSTTNSRSRVACQQKSQDTAGGREREKHFHLRCGVPESPSRTIPSLRHPATTAGLSTFGRRGKSSSEKADVGRDASTKGGPLSAAARETARDDCRSIYTNSGHGKSLTLMTRAGQKRQHKKKKNRTVLVASGRRCQMGRAGVETNFSQNALRGRATSITSKRHLMGEQTSVRQFSRFAG